MPEITDWQPLTENDSYLVAASDGVLEQLNPQDVCDILSKLRADFAVRSELNSSCMHSLADCIVNAAFKKGSTDNMAAIILPFRSKVPMKTLPKEDCDGLHISDCPALGYNGYSIGLSGKFHYSCFIAHTYYISMRNEHRRHIGLYVPNLTLSCYMSAKCQ